MASVNGNLFFRNTSLFTDWLNKTSCSNCGYYFGGIYSTFKEHEYIFGTGKCPICKKELSLDGAHGIVKVAQLINNKFKIPMTKSNMTVDKPNNEWEKIAFLFHNTYEGLAPKFGYETREDTKEFDPESNNGKLMIATCKAVISKTLQQQREEIIKEIDKKIENWCVDYMADANHNLEYNHRTPPIWEYLRERLKQIIN